MRQGYRLVVGGVVALGLLLASACGAPPEAVENSGAMGTAAEAVLVRCIADSGQLACSDAAHLDTCTVESTPLPSPDPLAASGLTHCSDPVWLTEPSYLLPGARPVLLWTCDPPAPGAFVPSTLWPDGWNGQPVGVYGMVKGQDGKRPSCGHGTDASNMCEMNGLNSDCYPEPLPGQVAVAMWVSPPCLHMPCPAGPRPSSCRGLCRTT
jgi:hypothetical protein